MRKKDASTSPKTSGKPSKVGSILGHWIVKNLLIAIGIVLVVCIGVGIFLSSYTRHGEKVLLPDFKGMTISEAKKVAKKTGVELIITDSVYNKRLQPGTIFSQLPKDSSYVKKDRHISIVINSFVPMKVKMPDLVDISLRQAMSNLSAKGLQLGRLIPRSYSQGSLLVLEQQYHGKNIFPGELIESGATIDLVFSVKDDDWKVSVPDVRGMNYLEAVSTLHDNTLNVTAKFDRSIRTYEDSLSAVVTSVDRKSWRSPIRGEYVTINLKPASALQK